MRCLCCNRNLTDYESTMRHPDTLEFIDICVKCLPDTTITPIVRSDLEPEEYDVDLELMELNEEMEEDDES